MIDIFLAKEEKASYPYFDVCTTYFLYLFSVILEVAKTCLLLKNYSLYFPQNAWLNTIRFLIYFDKHHFALQTYVLLPSLYLTSSEVLSKILKTFYGKLWYVIFDVSFRFKDFCSYLLLDKNNLGWTYFLTKLCEIIIKS